MNAIVRVKTLRTVNRPINVVTNSSPWNALGIVLALSLTLKFHGGNNGDALRATLRRLAKHCAYEFRQRLKFLAECKNDHIVRMAWQMFDQTAELKGYPSPRPPYCHMKPMTTDGHRFVCAHCKHTKPRTL